MKITQKLLMGTSFLLALTAQNVYSSSSFSLDDLAQGKHFQSTKSSGKEEKFSTSNFGAKKGSVVTLDDFSSEENDPFAAFNDKKPAFKAKDVNLDAENINELKAQVISALESTATLDDVDAVNTEVKKVKLAVNDLLKKVANKDDLSTLASVKDLKEISEKVANILDTADVGLKAVHGRVTKLENAASKVDISKLAKSDDVNALDKKVKESIIDAPNFGLRAVAERVKALEGKPAPKAVNTRDFANKTDLETTKKELATALIEKLDGYIATANLPTEIAKSIADTATPNAIGTVLATEATKNDGKYVKKGTTFTKDEVTAGVDREAARITDLRNELEAEKVKTAALIQDLTAAQGAVTALQQQVNNLITVIKAGGDLAAIQGAL